jgi:hypothetical protein
MPGHETEQWLGESNLIGFPVNHDEEFFIHFTHLFPIPHHFPHAGPGQPTCWQHVTPPGGITSATISLL